MSTSASQMIDAKIVELGDWRGKMLGRLRGLIARAVPGVVEEWKWMGTPVWSSNGIICTGETYKAVVKMTFAKGASLPDPAGLFNSSLEGNTRRAIDIREGEKVNEQALIALFRAAATLNATKPPKATRATKATKATKASKQATPSKAAPAKKIKLLSGGNPQISMADGDAPVQAYIAAMPGWRRDVGRRLDALITKNVPHVHKAVKWNSPFYGIKGQGWIVSFHTFTNYVKVTFFSGKSLLSPPQGGTAKDARWIDIHEDDFNEAQMKKWLRQAASLPGWGKI